MNELKGVTDAWDVGDNPGLAEAKGVIDPDDIDVRLILGELLELIDSSGDPEFKGVLVSSGLEVASGDTDCDTWEDSLDEWLTLAL